MAMNALLVYVPRRLIRALGSVKIRLSQCKHFALAIICGTTAHTAICNANSSHPTCPYKETSGTSKAQGKAWVNRHADEVD
jgi:hypothetical protein